jgi:hypothetical protein
LSKYKCRTHEIRKSGQQNVGKLIIINKALFRNELPPPYPGPPLTPGAAPAGACLLRAKTRAEPRKKTGKVIGQKRGTLL